MIFKVPDISCNHCKKRILDALSNVNGIEQLEVNVSEKTVEVSGSADPDTIKKVLHNAGYPVKE